ncbi:MAG: hypothetical protein ACRYG4_26355 [Janthinobacterium lividum]
MPRALVLVLFACALLVRLAVPTGWMPMVDATGFHVTICTGMGPVDAALAATSHDSHPAPAAPDHAAGDHACPFAALGIATAPPLDLLPVLPATVVVAIGTAAAAVAVGRGLAAPPPPSTGPPTRV